MAAPQSASPTWKGKTSFLPHPPVPDPYVRETAFSVVSKCKSFNSVHFSCSGTPLRGPICNCSFKAEPVPYKGVSRFSKSMHPPHRRAARFVWSSVNHCIFVYRYAMASCIQLARAATAFRTHGLCLHGSTGTRHPARLCKHNMGPIFAQPMMPKQKHSRYYLLLRN